MQTKFKRHQKVKLLLNPDSEYIEYYTDEKPEIKKGMSGEINILLPNGQYHVAIKDKKGEVIAYVQMSEDDLEPLEQSKGESAED